MKYFAFYCCLSAACLLAAFPVRCQESDWPQKLSSGEKKILLYEPHAEKLTGDTLQVRMAFAFYVNPEADPDFGVCRVKGKIITDRDHRKAQMVEMLITDIRFPEGKDSLAAIASDKEVRALVEHRSVIISIDELLTSLEQEEAQDQGIRNSPPEIIYRDHPAVLVLLDGEPKTRPVGKYGCQRVVNTPNLLLKSTESGRYYLSGANEWYESSDLSEGWTHCQKLPKVIKKTARELNPESGYSLPPAEEDLSAKTFNSDETEIILRKEPSELIVTKGPPDWRSIHDTQLKYAANTQEHLFLCTADNRFFLLISGRWFVSPSLGKGWEYVASDKLPPDFRRIPEEHVKSVVLPHVAGTAAAREAVSDTRIPQTAVIERKTASCSVSYDGEPEFQLIEGTGMSYAVNSTEPVIRIDTIYYVCENGVWFRGNTATGPWEAATSVPKDVRNIPPSCPVYPVRYVYIYGFTDEVIFTGYTPGYLGCYISGPTVVYGTGWYYPGWRGSYYHPYSCTYGFNMHYDPWWGWTCGYSWVLGGSDAWLFWYWSPMPALGWYHGWWGPYYRPPVYHYPSRDYYYGPRTRSIREISPRSSYNLYRQRTSGVSRLPETPKSIARPEPMRRSPNNVYADPGGDVIRKRGTDWERYNGSSWDRFNTSPRGPSGQPSVSPSIPEKLESERLRGQQRRDIYRQSGLIYFPIPVPAGKLPLPKGTIIQPRK
ncbi:MAG: hypothetical protein RL213_239 [Bacteroidota bacterium]